MSSNHPAIAVHGLSKAYTIRRNLTKHTTLADAVVARIKHPFRRPEKEVFWALRDLNFEVAPGEIVGIIGRNGAGKSTLLKILSRITRPTSGEVQMHGRVASLLEVGTGFHNELTGRENIFLNGAILGMRRVQIKAKFDEIVAFAEVDKFLDTPVKRYSSGMYVRLAFAIAAHLEPEILIVDEVLAVGDTAFQAKCIGKMQDVSGGGRTVLFVSHNLDSIMRLCSVAIWLDCGRLQEVGRPSHIVNSYHKHYQKHNEILELDAMPRAKSLHNHARLTKITCEATDTHNAWQYPFKAELAFNCAITISRTISRLSIAVAFFSSAGLEVASTRKQLTKDGNLILPGRYVVGVKIPNLHLAPKMYTINLGLSSEFGEEDFVSEAAIFEVVTNEIAADAYVDSISATCIPDGWFTINSLK